MKQPSPMRTCDHSGITLAETSISVMIVGMLVVAAMHSLTSSLRSSRFTQDCLRATLLAEALIVEISLLPWQDPQNPSSASTIGRDSDDPSRVDSRSQLDDMDDFDEWVESPVASRTGSPLSGSDPQWSRTVQVENLSTADPGKVVADNAGQELRRLTVIVSDHQRELSRLSVIVSKEDQQIRSASDQQRCLPNVREALP